MKIRSHRQQHRHLPEDLYILETFIITPALAVLAGTTYGVYCLGSSLGVW